MGARRTLKVTGHSKGTWALGQSRHLGLGHSGFWALDGHLCTQALEALYLADSVKSLNIM